MSAPITLPTPVRLTPELRKKVETAVDQLISMLDATAPDPDLEPWLGSMENHSSFYGSASGDRGTTGGRIGDQTHWAQGAGDDLEDKADGSEPSLGWTAAINQVRCGWAGSLDDREAEHDGREPDDDRENATTDDNGIADSEGACEQGFPGMRSWFDHVA
jgi:hypothetical protein